MSRQKRLSIHSVVGIVFSGVFIAVGLWAARKVLRELLLNPWRAYAAGQGAAPWLPTLLMAVFFVAFLSVPVRMIVRALRGMSKSQEAMAAEKLRAAAVAPSGPRPAPEPYRSQPGGGVVDRYRASLGALPFPRIETHPGRHLPHSLGSLASNARKGKKSNLFVGIPMALFVSVVFVALLRSGAVSGALLTLPFLAVVVFLLWPWIRPLFSGALLDPTVEIDRDLVVAGQPFRVFVGQPGPARIARLTVRLVCTEQVTYTQGTNTHTESREVGSAEILEELAFEIPKGGQFTRTLDATVPVDGMHSFEAANNRVEWAVRVEAEIDNWPDVKQTYPFGVVPGA